jgi:anti-sigma regulatory factor (Ser/Thr protein kinase)
MVIPKAAVIGDAVGRALAVEFDAEAAAVPSARRQVREALADWGLISLADDMALLVSELVANAAQHADGPVTLTLQQLGRAVLLEVKDSSPECPVPRRPDDHAETGRGLQLVASVADDWGFRTGHGAPGKTVWCRLSAVGPTVRVAGPAVGMAS